MLKLIARNEIITNEEPLALGVEFNTNDSIRYNAETNEIALVRPGYYDIDITMSFTNVTVDSAAIMLVADGVALPAAIATTPITAPTEEVTLNLSDTIRVLPSNLREYAKIGIMSTMDATLTNAIVTVKKVR